MADQKPNAAAPAKSATPAKTPAPATKVVKAKAPKKKKVPTPEGHIKAKKTAEQKAASLARHRVNLAKKRKLARVSAYKKAEKYAREYHQAERDLIGKRRLARNTGCFFVEAEPKVALVVRIRGINGVSPKVRKCLQLLRLRQIHNATFVRLNHASKQMLKLVEPYVTFGTPNLKTVKELIYKRGYGKVEGQRIRIQDNSVVSGELSRVGVTCVEDVVHEIFTCGPHFKTVNKFLWPFKLSSPNGGFVKKRIHFAEGGDAGDREHYINNLVRKMN